MVYPSISQESFVDNLPEDRVEEEMFTTILQTYEKSTYNPKQGVPDVPDDTSRLLNLNPYTPGINIEDDQKMVLLFGDHQLNQNVLKLQQHIKKTQQEQDQLLNQPPKQREHHPELAHLQGAFQRQEGRPPGPGVRQGADQGQAVRVDKSLDIAGIRQVFQRQTPGASSSARLPSRPGPGGRQGAERVNEASYRERMPQLYNQDSPYLQIQQIQGARSNAELSRHPGIKRGRTITRNGGGQQAGQYNIYNSLYNNDNKEYINDLDYQKYIKYKYKYLQLKATLFK